MCGWTRRIEVAALITARRRLGLSSGTLVTVPAPEEACMDPEEAEAAAAQAAREADEQGIHGPASTPWLLRRVVELTDGRSMVANTALLRNNGRVAAQIAVALANEGDRTRITQMNTDKKESPIRVIRVLFFGVDSASQTTL
jgi:pseudouridine-5'-phosphate glycosidase